MLVNKGLTRRCTRTRSRWSLAGERMKYFMPEMMIDIPIRKLAYMIDSMTSQELETLYMFLTEEGSELLERNRDLELGRVKYLSEEEAFDV